MPFIARTSRTIGTILIVATNSSVAYADTSLTAKNAFNPSTSVILGGHFAPFNNDPSNYKIPGFPLRAEIAPAPGGWSLDESELVLNANVDDYFYGNITGSLAPEGGLEVEEGYIETTSLGSGVTVRGGRFFSGIGYLNDRHAHTWDFTDMALPYRLLLGNQVRDDGVQVRWVLPTDRFTELGVEALRGESYPAGGSARNGRGAYAAYLHIGDDFGTSHSWRVGVSQYWGRATDRTVFAENIATAADLVSESFSGTSRVTLVDLIWKWSPNGNPYVRNLAFAFEYLHREDDGQLSTAYTGGGEKGTSFIGKQNGWYLQTAYQMTHGWRAGVRYAQARSDNSRGDAAVITDAGLDGAGHVPRVWSAMVDYNRSEFSRIRLQANLDRSTTATDKQLVLQYVVSIGAHSAHKF